MQRVAILASKHLSTVDNIHMPICILLPHSMLRQGAICSCACHSIKEYYG